MNLLEETLQDIAESGHTPEDIVFIGSRHTGHRCTWAEFEKLANVEYDASFGAQEVASDLEIVFSDGFSMGRSEYDGSEAWSYVKRFRYPGKDLPIKQLIVPKEKVGWKTLEEIN